MRAFAFHLSFLSAFLGLAVSSGAQGPADGDGRSAPLAPTAAALRAASYAPTIPSTQSASAGLRVTGRTYDDFDRLSSETVQLQDGATATLTYTYWNNGQRKTITDAAGRVTFYEYDGRNRLSRLTTNQGLPDERVTAYAYWPDSLLKSVTKLDGTVTSYDYDRADRLTSIAVRKGETDLLSYAYTYDRNGNRTKQVEANGGSAETTTYTYDDVNRLETVNYPDGRSVAYGYDDVGNRTAETERNQAGVVVSEKVAVFDAANRLRTVADAVNPANNATFAYDANGNLKTKTTAAEAATYTYDVRDLLVETGAGAAITARFAYDAFGRRYLKIGAEGIHQYLYDQTSLLEEFSESNVEVAKYEWDAERLVSLARLEEPRQYFHFDALGSVAALTDDTGGVVARYHYDAWGRHRDVAELDASANRFGFTGHYFDTETKLYYAKARYFDPDFGRFLTQDSYLGEIGDPPSLHRYLYANANPTRFVDRTGHCAGTASVANFQDCFTAAISGIVAPPTNFLLNWASGLAYRATGDKRFQARAEAFTGTAENVERSLRTPAHLLAATAQGFEGQLTGFSNAINEGRGTEAAEIFGGGLAQAPLIAEMGGGMRLTPGAAVAMEGGTIQAGGTIALTGGRGGVPAGIFLASNTSEAGTVKESVGREGAAPARPEGGSSGGPGQGTANNIKGAVFENVSDSAARRAGQLPFFRAIRRGGMDFGLLDDGTVILKETKFANRVQFDDFSAITTNLQANIAEIRANLSKAADLTREQRAMIGQTLDDALAGNAPGNLKIQVETGKAAVGPKLQAKLRDNTGGIPIEFVELPRQ